MHAHRSPFIRHHLSPYCLSFWEEVRIGDFKHPIERIIPAMKAPAPTPHGRHAYTGSPDDWGPDLYGYTDFDDYHLALYGA